MTYTAGQGGGDPRPSHREQVGELKRDIVAAGKILFRHRILDSFGHVSARHPADATLFLLPRRMAPTLVQADDVREFTLEGESAAPDDAPTFVERFIHSEIYKARPDVNAIVHSHAPGAVAASAVPDLAFRPIAHTCGFLREGAARFEIRDFAGDESDLLIRNSSLGEALARTLGLGTTILMRGHGSTVVGSSIPEAVYRAIYLEANASMLVMALTMGVPVFLTTQEAEAAELTGPLQTERSWQAWKRDLDE